MELLWRERSLPAHIQANVIDSCAVALRHFQAEEGLRHKLFSAKYSTIKYMPRTCTICVHPQRLEIEKAIVTGTSLRDIADQFGPSKNAVMRHRTHVSDAIARSTEALELVRSGVLLDDVRVGEGRAERLYAHAEEMLASALKDKDPRTGLQAIRAAVSVMGEARAYLE